MLLRLTSDNLVDSNMFVRCIILTIRYIQDKESHNLSKFPLYSSVAMVWDGMNMASLLPIVTYNRSCVVAPVDLCKLRGCLILLNAN